MDICRIGVDRLGFVSILPKPPFHLATKHYLSSRDN